MEFIQKAWVFDRFLLEEGRSNLHSLSSSFVEQDSKAKREKKKRKEEGLETWRENERSWIPSTFALARATICLSRFCCQHFRSIRAWWTDDGAAWMQLICLIWQLPLWTQSAILFTNCWFVPPFFSFLFFFFLSSFPFRDSLTIFLRS